MHWEPWVPEGQDRVYSSFQVKNSVKYFLARSLDYRESVVQEVAFLRSVLFGVLS